MFMCWKKGGEESKRRGREKRRVRPSEDSAGPRVPPEALKQNSLKLDCISVARHESGKEEGGGGEGRERGEGKGVLTEQLAG